MPFPVEEKYIKAAEEELGVTFPDSVRASFMKMNGGEFSNGELDWDFYPFFDKSDRKRISRTANHIVRETMEARKWHNFPKRGVAMGRDGYGNQIIMRPKLLQRKKL